MSKYIILLIVVGLAALSMAWLPNLTKNKPYSYPILYIAIGALLYSFPLDLPSPNPLYNEGFVVRLTEMSVIISLMGTGLKINRAFSWRHWHVPFRLVSITMLLCIGATAFLGWAGLGLSIAAAVLLGAVLAPTDPVLAADVQVSPPKSDSSKEKEKNDHVRFALTAEAGLNDGMAFPFTWLGIQIAIAAAAGTAFLWEWAWYDLLYRIIAGIAMGYLIGKGIAFLLYDAPRKFRLPKASDGFVALSATLLVYGLTEMVHGYGFMAVFVAGLTISSDERHAEFHREMHDFTDQMERILMVLVLIPFGGNLIEGMLNSLTWGGVVLGLVFLFIIRPAAGMIGLLRTELSIPERLTVSFFGIRGIGSFFYLAFALYKVEFAEEDQLWAITGFIVLVSIIMHGISASPVLKWLDRRRNQEQGQAS